MQRLSINRYKEETQRMDYINAFWVGGLICALGADPDGKDEDDAGTHYGALSGHRCRAQCAWLV